MTQGACPAGPNRANTSASMWNGFRGSLPAAVAVLERWPHLAQLGATRRSTLIAALALHTCGVANVADRVEAIRSAVAA